MRTLRSKTKSLMDSIQFHTIMRFNFHAMSNDYCRYSLCDVIDDSLSYYIIIGVPFGLRRRYKKVKYAMRQYNNDTCALRDLVW
jgi:hypothetical protein